MAQFTNKEYKPAYTLSHTIKGAAGNIAAMDLFEASRVIENLAKLAEDQQQPPETDALKDALSVYSKRLKVVVTSLQSVTPPPQ